MRVYCFDDNPYELSLIQQQLKNNAIYKGFEVTPFSSYKDYQKAIIKDKEAELDLDVAILDIHVQQEQFNVGLLLAEDTRRLFPQAVIIIRSSFDDAKTVVHCLNSGADEFISKNSAEQELALRILHAKKVKDVRSGFSHTETTTDLSKVFAGETLKTIAARIPQILDSAINAVHILGETGTGKEVVANLFAEHLPRGMPFIRVNCGAIAPTLLESELFGHVRGAFTGALSDKKGLMEEAAGGWIFLDEVASLSSPAQVSLLRVLENGELRPVGSNKNKRIHVRVLSASNQDLETLVTQGKFRQDLLQRLADTKLVLPPLRERPQDIIPIARFICASFPGGPYEITEPTLEILSHLPWKNGNVRELRNCLRAMTEYSSAKLLTPMSLPQSVWQLLDDVQGEEAQDAPKKAGKRSLTLEWQEGPEGSFEQLVDQLLANLITEAVKGKSRLSLRSLATQIGMARTTLSERIKRLSDKNLLSKEHLAKILSS